MTNDSSIKAIIEARYRQQYQQFISCDWFGRLTAGALSKAELIDFVSQLCQAHLRSPQVLAFLFAMAPPAARERVKDNMLEELGLLGEDEPHPQLLRKLAKAIPAIDHDWQHIEIEADNFIRYKTLEPFLFVNLTEFSLSAMLETFAFEWVLARVTSQFADALRRGLDLGDDELEWFLLHSEVDIVHAEEGLQTLVEFIEYFDIDSESLSNIIGLTFRYNVFAKRYCNTLIEFDD